MNLIIAELCSQRGHFIVVFREVTLVASCLCSASIEHCTPVSSQLADPRSRLKGFGDHAFSIATLSLRNALPGSITDCKCIDAFKRKS